MPSASRSSSPSMMEPSLPQRHRELLGPRPAPLKVSTSTTTGTEMFVKKRRLQPRQPVIIYVESPRVVHAHPGEFKSVVQRLTGAPPPPPMVFPASASALPHQALQLQLQLPFQFPLVGASGSALLPLTSSIMPSVTVADASGTSSVVGQENLSSHPFLLPLPSSSSSSSSLAAACYHQHQHQHHGSDLFITHHHQ